tara:strand:+ start:4999 stop:5133 length:135 start_codon:yes stop_codon:yes gene_type:complete
MELNPTIQWQNYTGPLFNGVCTGCSTEGEPAVKFDKNGNAIPAN